MPLPPHSTYLLCSSPAPPRFSAPLARHLLGYKIGMKTELALCIVVEPVT